MVQGVARLAGTHRLMPCCASLNTTPGCGLRGLHACAEQTESRA